MGDSESVAGVAGMDMSLASGIGAKNVLMTQKSIMRAVREVTLPVSDRVPETPEARMVWAFARLNQATIEAVKAMPPREDFVQSFVKDHPNALDL
jgi:hypothetical protein